MSEIFRIYVKDLGAIMTHQELRGMWEAACIEAGGKPEPGGVTVHRVPGRSGRVVVAGRAERKPAVVSEWVEPALNRKHSTCIDVTSPTAEPRSGWMCGPNCPDQKGPPPTSESGVSAGPDGRR